MRSSSADTDKLKPANSYTQTPGVLSPKATLTWGREQGGALPQLSISFGKAFHANAPRIGSGSGRGALIVQSRESFAHRAHRGRAAALLRERFAPLKP